MIEHVEFSIWQVLLHAIQLLYSWWLKNYSNMNNRWIPLINLCMAFGWFAFAYAASNSKMSPTGAFISVFLKAIETMIISTSIHSIVKNTIKGDVTNK